MGLMAIYSIKELTERAQILRIALLTAIAGIAFFMWIMNFKTNNKK